MFWALSCLSWFRARFNNVFDNAELVHKVYLIAREINLKWYVDPFNFDWTILTKCAVFVNFPLLHMFICWLISCFLLVWYLLWCAWIWALLQTELLICPLYHSLQVLNTIQFSIQLGNNLRLTFIIIKISSKL